MLGEIGIKTDTNAMAIYNIDETFSINPDMQISIEYIGKANLPVLVIDDFYKNPEIIRELVINTPVKNGGCPKACAFPEKRFKLNGFLDSDLFQSEISKLLSRQLKVDYNLNLMLPTLVVNIMDGEPPLYTKGKKNIYYPHADRGVVASVVYLNYDDEKVGGTAFYHHILTDSPVHNVNKDQTLWWVKHQGRQTGDDLRVLMNKEKERFLTYKKIEESYSNINEKKFVLNSNHDWKLTQTIEAKFNRFVAHFSNYYHGPHVDLQEMCNVSHKRITQVMFWKKKE